MDKSILRKFATESRTDLMEKMRNKINLFYIDEEFEKEQRGELFVLTNNNHSLSLTKEDYQKRELLIKRIKDISIEQVIEESAYTWFNRIIAIRYMELNDILPLSNNNDSLGFRVLSAKDNTLDPEILKFTNLNNADLDINLDKEYYLTLKTDNDKFKYILLLICQKLGKIIPQVFDGITDYIDLLIPDNLLNDSGFVNKVVNEIPDNNFKEVEIIGWLYQYYNQNEKDRVISSKKAYKKNEIAYATQLFTPDWIVKYMVENSLGKYVIEYNADKELINNWKYFIKDNLEIKKETINPTKITFIDPCMGSGHILVYAFEVLYQIYESYGYNKNDIPELILKNNLYGLDIDDRAGQLAVLSVVLKACNYNKRILNNDVIKNLNILSIQESSNISENDISYLPENVQGQANELKDLFINAKEIGSLLLTEQKDYSDLINYLTNDFSLLTLSMDYNFNILNKQSKILSNKYDVVVTNPPYLNNSVMTANMKNYVQTNYKEVKSDLFSAFILRDSYFGKENAYLGFMTPFVWMFISSYENLRKYIINNLNITSLIQLEYSALEEATVPICTFVLKNRKEDVKGTYFKLSDFKGGMKVQSQKVLEALSSDCDYVYRTDENNFNKIPGNPIAYWISNNFINCFSSKRIADYGTACVGLQTSDNKRFLREWYEIKFHKIGFSISSLNDSLKSKKKWFPYNKGGEYRKWFGNNSFVVNWEENGREVKEYNDFLNKSRASNIGIANTNYYFKESGTWGLVSSAKFSVRYSPTGSIFDTGGSSLFSSNLIYLIGLLNTTVSEKIMQIQNPTLNFQPGNVSNVPVIIDEEMKIKSIVEDNINISKTEWDSFEASWDFEKHPLMPRTGKVYDMDDAKKEDGYLWLSAIYENWEKWTIEQFNKLKLNEEELNRIFIDIYGLQDELDPYVEDKDVTIRKADKVREIKSLISYAVGCMFGRYSLDETGLVYAGGEFDSNKYKTYKVDMDNIIPITDEAYFNDDIVSRFVDFIKVVYGESTLYENLEFIADTLGKRGTETNEDTIRRYFNNDFFADHCKIYKKKPIYWLFDSGKKNGFKCLVYMHRYNENLVPKVRLDYLHKLQNTYEKLLSDINYKLTTDLSMVDKKDISKKQIDMNNKLIEIREYDEKIAHIADRTISIDLDDGVTVNHAKFEDILAKIK